MKTIKGKAGDVRVGYFITTVAKKFPLTFERKCIKQEIIPFRGMEAAKERAAAENQDLVVLEMIG